MVITRKSEKQHLSRTEVFKSPLNFKNYNFMTVNCSPMNRENRRSPLIDPKDEQSDGAEHIIVRSLCVVQYDTFVLEYSNLHYM